VEETMRNFLVVAVLLSGCASTLTGKPKGFDQYFSETPAGPTDIFEGRILLPRSSCDTEPSLCVGGVFVLRAKEGKKCNSSTPDDFERLELLKLPDETLKECTTRIIHRDRPQIAIRTTGTITGDLSYIIGSASTNDQVAYDFRVAEPVSAVAFSYKCYRARISQLSRVSVPPRSCRVMYFPEITVLQTSYRRYTKWTGKSENSYTSAFKLNTVLYTETSDERNRAIILGALPKAINSAYPSEKGTGYLRSRNAGDQYIPPPDMSESEYETGLKLEPQVTELLRKLSSE